MLTTSVRKEDKYRFKLRNLNFHCKPVCHSMKLLPNIAADIACRHFKIRLSSFLSSVQCVCQYRGEYCEPATSPFQQLYHTQCSYVAHIQSHERTALFTKQLYSERSTTENNLYLLGGIKSFVKLHFTNSSTWSKTKKTKNSTVYATRLRKY